MSNTSGKDSEKLKINPDELLRLDNQLCFPLYAAARKIVGAYTPYLKPLGITYTQYITFMVLWEQDGLTVGEIGEKLHLDNGTLTPLLKKMESQGYLIRRRGLEDERRVTVHLTGRGRDMKAKLIHVPLQIGKCLPLSRPEAEELYHLLYKILDADPDSAGSIKGIDSSGHSLFHVNIPVFPRIREITV